jgi:hypothetical protein
MPLNDPKAIEIISKARRPNVARPRESDRDFQRIFSDFFANRMHDRGFAGQLVMDLGPGQYDFARMIRHYGGQCENIDIDPAVIELGQYLGEVCHKVDMIHMDAEPFRSRFDGLFCKFSINALWFHDIASAGHLVTELDSMLKPGGWGWIAPWNGRPKSGFDDALVRTMLDAQRTAFLECGWIVHELSKQQAAYYGMGGTVENNPLYLKNLALLESLH